MSSGLSRTSRPLRNARLTSGRAASAKDSAKATKGSGQVFPLGARALYLFQNGKDTLYRLHGSPEYWTIGTSGSSGCIRFMNQDIIDLYDRVPSGSPVLVRQGGLVA